jgi:hypothetical protein
VRNDTEKLLAGVFERDPRTGLGRTYYMKKPIALLALLGIAAASPALARSSTFGTSACLHRSEIYDVRAFEGNMSLLVTDNARKLYKVTFHSKCYALNTHTAIRFVELDNTRLACLERGDGIVHVGDFGNTPRCTISNIEYFHPETEVQPVRTKSIG